MSEISPIEALLRRDRAIVATGLGLLAVLAWAFVLDGAGTGMSPWAMTRLAFFPGGDWFPMEAAPWTGVTWIVMVAMWWIMMIAMMIPSAAPMILLHARVTRHAQAKGRMGEGVVPTAAFLAGYLIVWLGFSITATALQWAGERSGLLSQPMMWSMSAWLAAGLLVAAGLYQWSPLKQVCLRHCRAPAEFLSHRWRPGRRGAFVMGIEHGAYCLGCCWSLMALLFVGGIMNVAWIAGLAIVVLLEKLLPYGWAIARALGAAFVAAGLWVAAAAL